MKKLFLLSVVLSFVCATHAQTEFSVPSPTLEQKYDNTRWLMNNYIISCISVAKSDGMTAKEFGKKCGEVFAPLWDVNTGFEQIVNFMLDYWAWLADDVQIIEQSNEKVVITVPHIYPWLEDEGVLVGVSLEEFLAYVNTVHVTIFNLFDVGFDLTKGEEGFKTVITQ
jgi:hypothetical protein